jgi:hypothetical protein
MNIIDAQREIRFRFSGGCFGQAVSGIIWLLSAGFASSGQVQTAIALLVMGGFFIFPITELLVRTIGSRMQLQPENTLTQLGLQAAFVLPLSMPLLVPVCKFNLNLFYPALMILLGAHYLPFVFLYGMRMFAILASLLLAGGVVIATNLPGLFSIGGWYTGIVLLIFAAVGKLQVQRESLVHVQQEKSR